MSVSATCSTGKITAANPFAEDVFVQHSGGVPHTPLIHREAFARIAEAAERLCDEPPGTSSTGRTLLLTAPRAGYGKTHLADRLRDRLRPIATSLTLPLDPSRPASWPVALSSILRQFYRETGTRNGAQSQFDETGRYLLAQVVLSHLAGGSIHPKDCPADEARLRSEFAELFSSESSPKMLAWIDKRARDLSQDTSPEFRRSLGLSKSELSFWSRLVIDFHLRGDSALEPLRGLSNGEARERLLQWLRIAAFYRPVLLVVDGLDGFHGSETAGMEIGALLTGIRDSVPRSLTALLLNEDVWDSVFRGRLPSAWVDRIAGEHDWLHPIEPEGARELVRLRLDSIGFPEKATDRFIERLDNDHLWIDPETKLTPRGVIRQARDLWSSEGPSFLVEEDQDEAEIREIAEKRLSELTDKVEFFQALQADCAPPLSEEEQTPPRLDPEENPFFPDPDADRTEPIRNRDMLAGIESIIADIRGSGKTVVSEAPANRKPSGETEDVPREIEKAPAVPFEAGHLQVVPKPKAAPAPPIAPAEEFHRPESAAPNVVARLAELESELLDGPALQLDLERLEKLFRTVGSRHPALSQREERHPSSRTACLRWNVRGQSILIGFESPKNVYFWNNLLQQSLASSGSEKIAAFSHDSQPFDPSLFASFGFSPAVTEGHIDVVTMNDRELAMIEAAAKKLEESTGTIHEDHTIQAVTRYLDPLWRRISRPI